MTDVNEIRDREIALHGLTKVDERYTLFYDETNNIRRLHIGPNGLNVSEPRCFVVGGVGHLGERRDLGLEELRRRLRIQKTALEIKLEHVAKGNFLELLRDKRLEVFLRWLLEEGLFIHYSTLDPMYWSIVDIIDSILAVHRGNALLMSSWALKDSLYTILRHDQADTVALFGRYQYPDVGRERRLEFLAEIRERLDARTDLLDRFSAMMLKGVLQLGEKLDSLAFLEDEPPNVLIDGFGVFFVQRICIFKNSSHIFDVERVVQNYIGGQILMDGGRPVSNYRFAISHDEPAVQISDVVVGMLGKFYSMLQQSTREEIIQARRSLNPRQEISLSLLRRLRDRSIEENPAFAHVILSLEDRQREALFLDE
jgi:hypothetical protein